MSKVLVSETNLVAIGDAIREKNGENTKYKPGDMAAAILEIQTGIEPVGDITITENGEYDVVNYAKAIVEVAGSGGEDFEVPVITKDCQYRFSFDGWTWVIKQFGDKITTEDISNCNSMFYNSVNLREIPFEINCGVNYGLGISMNNMFYGCQELRHIPKINGLNGDKVLISNLTNMFQLCRSVERLPEDIDTWFDWSKIEGSSSGNRSSAFNMMGSLRVAPMDFLEHEYSTLGYRNCIYYNAFISCCSLDEIIGLPINGRHILNATTSNMFASTFKNCSRLKNMTFKSYTTDAVPVRPVKWKSQIIDLSSGVGYAATYSERDYIRLFGGGLLKEDFVGKEITDDATYQALKDDPNSFTSNINYSRYNHDSAVRTINSLPDTSAYLASAGGTNTIKFLGASGALTDGGAINTLTEEEIAVATARGWTVSLV